ncbi:MAG: FtsX-like permease family protein [Acidobacteria bacterium]|nr:FtsX-like permease family protein [Acidobacteriota bacterium]
MKLPWNKERADLDREVAYHIDSLADTYQAEGLSRAEALRKARREFGGIDLVKDQCRDESRWRLATQFMQDLQFGWRMMRKSPAISVAAVASLALGIGATTAIFTFAEAVLWRKLPVPAPEQILELYSESIAPPDRLIRGSSGSNFRDGGLRVADYFSQAAVAAMTERAAGKVEIAAHIYGQPVSVSYAGNVAVSKVRGVSPNFFPLLRIHPAAGRQLGSGLEVLVTHGFWERRLQRSESAPGQTLRINNLPYTIAGILPRDFAGTSPGDEAELYTTIEQSPEFLAPDSWYRRRKDDPFAWWMQVIGRRAEGVSNQEAQTVLNAAFAASWAGTPKSAEDTPRIRLADASTGIGGLRRQMGDPAWILLGLVTLVLLVACANIANLLLSRAAEREKEVALRISLGCGSGRLLRQFLTESFLLAALGGALSAAVALGIGQLMRAVLPVGLNADTLLVDASARTLAATAGISLLTLLLFGLYPAWRASRIDASPALKQGIANSNRHRWLPAKILVLAQVALGVLLVTAGILYTGNLNEIVARDSGFDRTQSLLFDLRPGELGYSGDRLETYYRNVEERLSAIPGVLSMGLSRIRPMRGGGFHDGVSLPGGSKSVNSGFHFATAGFLPALGVQIVAGRALTAEEVRAGRKVVVVSELLVQSLGIRAPLGAKIEDSGKNVWEIAGVARNASYSRLTNPMPVVYRPLPKDIPSVTVVLRTGVPPLSVLPAARHALREIDPGIPLVDVFSMEQQISRTLQRERMFAWLCGSFGVLALVLCAVGLYGLMAHSTARRTPEIGIRIALGAPSRAVLRQIASEGMALACGGIILGAPIAVYAAHIAQKQRMLPEGAIPYWTLFAAIGVLLAAAFAAVAGPAMRAASIDPMRALREG